MLSRVLAFGMVAPAMASVEYPAGCCNWDDIGEHIGHHITFAQIFDELPCTKSDVPVDSCNYVFPEITPKLVEYIWRNMPIQQHINLDCSIMGVETFCPSSVMVNTTFAQARAFCPQLQTSDRAGPNFCESNFFETMLVYTSVLSCVLLGVFALLFLLFLINVMRGCGSGRDLKSVIIDSTLIWPFGFVLWINWKTNVEYTVLSQLPEAYGEVPADANKQGDDPFELPAQPDHTENSATGQSDADICASELKEEHKEELNSADWRAPVPRKTISIRESWEGVQRRMPREQKKGYVDDDDDIAVQNDWVKQRSTLQLQNQFRKSRMRIKRIDGSVNTANSAVENRFKVQETIETVFAYIFCFLNCSFWAFIFVIIDCMAGGAFSFAGVLFGSLFLSSYSFLKKLIMKRRAHTAFLFTESDWLNFQGMGEARIGLRSIFQGLVTLFLCVIGTIVIPFWLFLPITLLIFAPAYITSLEVAGYIASAHYHELRDFGQQLLKLDDAHYLDERLGLKVDIAEKDVHLVRIVRRLQTHENALESTKEMLYTMQAIGLSCNLVGMNVCITSMFIMLGTDGADRMDFVIALGLIGGFFLVDAALDLYRYARIGDAYTELLDILSRLILAHTYDDSGLDATYNKLKVQFGSARAKTDNCWRAFGKPLTSSTFSQWIWGFGFAILSTMVGFIMTLADPAAS